MNLKLKFDYVAIAKTNFKIQTDLEALESQIVDRWL